MKIILDCERMKYRHTGFYHFCFHLGHELLQQTADTKPLLAFYIPPAETGIFGDSSNYLLQKSWHKFYNPFASQYHLWHGTYQGSMYYPKAKSQKRILTIHDLNFMFDDKKSVANKKKHLRIMQEKINRSDQLTCISQFTLNHVKEHLNIDDTPVEVIYNGCNVPASMQPNKPGFINNSKPFLFSVGTIIKEKNFHVLPALLKNNEYTLIIAGITQDELYKEQILSEAKKWGVADRVILPGSITENEKWWLMGHCLAFFFPSLAEGFGLPVIEAMHFGKPVLLSKYTCLPEIGGNAAYYFNSFDPEDMRNTLMESLQHFETHKRSIYIKQHAAFFNWATAAKNYWSLYMKLL